MKPILILLAAALFVPAFAQRHTTVRGYYTKKGKYVAPHERSLPDHNFYNNWSSRGNRNPVTGKTGTEAKPPKRRVNRPRKPKTNLPSW